MGSGVLSYFKGPKMFCFFTFALGNVLLYCINKLYIAEILDLPKYISVSFSVPFFLGLYAPIKIYISYIAFKIRLLSRFFHCLTILTVFEDEL